MAQKLYSKVSVNLSGVDLTTPVDALKDGVSPNSRNFRLFAQQKDSRRVAVSTRKGSGEYSTPLLEAQNASQTTSTNGTTPVTINGIVAQPFTPSTTGRLTKLDIEASNNGGTGPLLVDIYTTKDDMPYQVIATSSNSSLPTVAGYVSMRFIAAPLLTSGTKYWIVARQQDNATGSYLLTTTATGSHAYTSNVGVALMNEQDYSIRFKTYLSPDSINKNAYRFEQDFGINRTLVAFGTTMYVYNEDTKQYDTLKTGLNALADDYSFSNGDGKAFWVNGYDDLMAWNGTSTTTNPDTIANGTFEVNASNWDATGGGTGAAVARTTGDFHSGTASLLVSATSGNRSANQATGMVLNREVEVTAWVKAVAGSSIYAFAVGTNETIPGSSIVSNGSWQQIKARYIPGAAVTAIRFMSTANFNLDDVSMRETGLEVIKDTELPILKYIEFHKNRLYGVVANLPNRFVYSEAPGIPAFEADGTTPVPANKQWYNAWLSVSFQEVPRPKNGSPITGMVSFQDNLIILTQDMKYVWSGSDRGQFYLRESTGQEGALSFRSFAKDANILYLISKNGVFAFNGSKDEKLSKEISPLFDACPRKKYMSPVVWKNHLRIYMASESSNVNDICAIYSTEYKTWLIDTECYVDRAITYDDADDNNELVEFSSLAPTMYKAEQAYSNLGAPIDFEYQMKYDSMGAPGQKKKIKKLYPIIQGADNTFPVTVSVDKDFADSPKEKKQVMSVEGAKWGQFKWGDGTKYGGDKSFKLKKVSTSGKARYWQIRVARRGVNNRVAFIGIQFTYKLKKL